MSSHLLNGFYPSSLLVRICELPIRLPLPVFKFPPMEGEQVEVKEKEEEEYEERKNKEEKGK